jgi:hypothetical protein
MELLKNQTWLTYECMYGAYKLLYRKFIFNSLATIIQLINFLT